MNCDPEDLIILTFGGIVFTIYCLIVVIKSNQDYHKITYMQNAILLQEKKEKMNETSEMNKVDKMDKTDKVDKVDKNNKMNKLRIQGKKKFGIVLFWGLLAIALVSVSGCGNAPQDNVKAENGIDNNEVMEETEATNVLALTNTPIPTSAPAPTNTPTPEPFELLYDTWSYVSWGGEKLHLRVIEQDCNKENCRNVVIPSFPECYAGEENPLQDYMVCEIGEYAFRGCYNLASVTIPDSVKYISRGAFEGCSSLTSITIPDGVISIGEGAFEGCTGLTSITIPNGVERIEPFTFSGCTGLTSITIPESVTVIEEDAFANCENLVKVEIKGNLEKFVIGIFKDCKRIKDYKGPEWVMEYNVDRGDVTECTIPDGISGIDKNTFSKCESLRKVTISNSVRVIYKEAFARHTSLESVTIPASCTVGGGAFRGCTGLTSVTFSDGVENPDWWVAIGDYAFDGCTGLTSITIPGGVGWIGQSAFIGCTNLTSVVILDGVTEIKQEAFCDCINLTSITIPASVTSINFNNYKYVGVFERCWKVETVKVKKGSYAEDYAKRRFGESCIVYY